MYDGIHIPMSALTHKGYNDIHEMEHYEFNAFLYFYELNNELD